MPCRIECNGSFQRPSLTALHMSCPCELTRRFTFGDWAEEYFLQIRTIKKFSKLWYCNVLTFKVLSCWQPSQRLSLSNALLISIRRDLAVSANLSMFIDMSYHGFNISCTKFQEYVPGFVISINCNLSP